MSTSNQGNQQISWKYSTPLKAEYLNSALGGVTSEGLVTRPTINTTTTTTPHLVTIQPFSIFIKPSDLNEFNLCKITFTSSVTIQCSADAVAIGVKYSFKDGETVKSAWYAEVVPLTSSQLTNFKGVIIATRSTVDGSQLFTTQGADISDVLLSNEGFNPSLWVSKSRTSGYECRWHNKTWSNLTDISVTIDGGYNTFNTITSDTDITETSGVFYIKPDSSNLKLCHSSTDSEEWKKYPVVAKFNTVEGKKIVTPIVDIANLSKESITTVMIQEKAVTTEKINDSAVTRDKINDGAVTYAKLHADLKSCTKRFSLSNGVLTITDHEE